FRRRRANRRSKTKLLKELFMESTGTDWSTILMIAGGVVGLIFFIIVLAIVPIGLWITAKTAGAGVSMLQLVAMRLRKVPPAVIVGGRINSLKAGLTGVSVDQLEAHFLAGGHVEMVVNALISAEKAGIHLDFGRAAAIDLAGRHVFEA